MFHAAPSRPTKSVHPATVVRGTAVVILSILRILGCTVDVETSGEEVSTPLGVVVDVTVCVASRVTIVVDKGGSDVPLLLNPFPLPDPDPDPDPDSDKVLGSAVGICVGSIVGPAVGLAVGLELGSIVGDDVGIIVDGTGVGLSVGVSVSVDGKLPPPH